MRSVAILRKPFVTLFWESPSLGSPYFSKTTTTTTTTTTCEEDRLFIFPSSSVLLTGHITVSRKFVKVDDQDLMKEREVQKDRKIQHLEDVVAGLCKRIDALEVNKRSRCSRHGGSGRSRFGSCYNCGARGSLGQLCSHCEDKRHDIRVATKLTNSDDVTQSLCSICKNKCND